MIDIPTGPFLHLGKFEVNLYLHFFKGAKIDAHLEPDYMSPFGEPDGQYCHNRNEDIYSFKRSYTLVLKNTSAHPARNVKLVNAEEIFYQIIPMDQNLYLKEDSNPYEVKCRFCLDNITTSEPYLRKYQDAIPEDKLGKNLFISYQNEAGKTFYTAFKIDLTNTSNEYLLKLPDSIS